MVFNKKILGMILCTVLIGGCAGHKERKPSSDGTWGNSGAPEAPYFIITKNKYLGKNQFETEFLLKNTEDVASVTLEYGWNGMCPLQDLNPKIVLKKKFSFSRKLTYRPPQNTVCDNEYNSAIYDSVIAVMKDGSVKRIQGINFYMASVMSSTRPSEEKSPLRFSSEMVATKKKKVPLEDAFASNKKTKERTIETYEVTTEASPSDLAEFSGILMPNGSEFFSDDPAKLADFLKENKVMIDLYRENKAKVVFNPLCLPTTNCSAFVYEDKKSPPDERIAFAVVKLIYKGDISYVQNIAVRLR